MRCFVPLPTQSQLAIDPAIASVALLETALYVTACAFWVGIPEIEDMEEIYADGEPPRSLVTARRILEKIDALSEDLASYRRQRDQENGARDSTGLPF